MGGCAFGGWLVVVFEEVLCLLLEEMVYKRLLRAAVMFKFISYASKVVLW